jgi:hypothetical protein
MPTQVVDLSARSRIVRGQRFLCHAWVATPVEVLAFLRDPRVELKKLGVHLPSNCRVETVLENHDWLSGHTDGFERPGRVSILCRGEGDGSTFYKVSLFANKTSASATPLELLHASDEEGRSLHRLSNRSRHRLDATRRSLRASPLQLAAHRWVAPLLIQGPANRSTDEAHRIFDSITQFVGLLVRQSTTLQEARDEVAAFLQRPIKSSYSMVFRSEGGREVGWHGAFTSAMYARALWMFRTSGFHMDAMMSDVKNLLKDPSLPLRTLREAVASLEPDFIPHTLVAVNSMRQEDPMLDTRLREAEDLFTRFDPDRSAKTSRFYAPAKGLEHLAPANAGEWWHLPALVAFAISVWPPGASEHRAKN